MQVSCGSVIDISIASEQIRWYKEPAYGYTMLLPPRTNAFGDIQCMPLSSICLSARRRALKGYCAYLGKFLCSRQSGAQIKFFAATCGQEAALVCIYLRIPCVALAASIMFYGGILRVLVSCCLYIEGCGRYSRRSCLLRRGRLALANVYARVPAILPDSRKPTLHLRLTILIFAYVWSKGLSGSSPQRFRRRAPAFVRRPVSRSYFCIQLFFRDHSVWLRGHLMFREGG